MKLTKQEFENLIVGVTSKALDAKVKELGLDAVDRRFGMFPGALIGKSEDELSKMEKRERIAAFIKAVAVKDVATLGSFKALSEGTGSAGGFQVPDEFAAELNRIAEDFGLVRKLARKLPMGSDTLNVPRLASSVTVSFPGEGAAGTASDPVWEQVQLLAKTAVGLTVTSNELLADANISIVDLLTELFAEALSGEEDKQGLTGSGAPFTGILNAAGVNLVVMSAGNDTFGEVTADNLRDLVAKVKPLALRGAAFIMHREVWSIVQKLKGSDGHYIATVANPILLPGATVGEIGGAVVGTIWGYPVYLSEKMPSVSAVSTDFIIFGALNYLWFGDRQQMTMNVSDAGVVAGNSTFERNQSAVRITERIAISVGLPAAFAKLRTAAA